MLDKIIAIAGYSGHGFVVTDVALNSNIKLTHYTNIKKSDANPYKLNYLGVESDPFFFKKNPKIEFVLGIGDNKLRKKTYELITLNKVNTLNVIDNSSVISVTAELGSGIFVSKGVVINTLSKIGNACIINTGAIIEHECTIGNYSHVGPGAVLAGNVNVGDNCFIGANSVVKQGITITDNVIVGAGAVVVKNILEPGVLVGNPAKRLIKSID